MNQQEGKNPASRRSIPGKRTITGDELAAALELGFFGRRPGDLTELRGAVSRLDQVMAPVRAKALLDMVLALERDGKIREKVHTHRLASQRRDGAVTWDISHVRELQLVPNPRQKDLAILQELADSALAGNPVLEPLYNFGIRLCEYLIVAEDRPEVKRPGYARELREAIMALPQDVLSQTPLLSRASRTRISIYAGEGGFLIKVFNVYVPALRAETLTRASRIQTFFNMVCGELREHIESVAVDLAPQAVATSGRREEEGDRYGRESEDRTDAAVADITQPESSKRRSPSKEAIAAYRLIFLKGFKQQEAAEYLSKEYGRRISQGTVSRWLRQTEKWIEAGNVLQLLPKLDSKPQSVDPEILDMGKRQDGRAPHQRDCWDDE